MERPQSSHSPMCVALFAPKRSPSPRRRGRGRGRARGRGGPCPRRQRWLTLCQTLAPGLREHLRVLRAVAATRVLRSRRDPARRPPSLARPVPRPSSCRGRSSSTAPPPNTTAFFVRTARSRTCRRFCCDPWGAAFRPRGRFAETERARAWFSRTLAQQMAQHFQDACPPFQYALFIRAGAECLAPLLSAATEATRLCCLTVGWAPSTTSTARRMSLSKAKGANRATL